jgi:hypothetical protein
LRGQGLGNFVRVNNPLPKEKTARATKAIEARWRKGKKKS